VTTAVLAAATFAFPTLALADGGTVDAMSQNVVTGANTAIKNFMSHSVSQAPPVQQPKPNAPQGLPTGLTYTFDLSMAYPFGNIGTFGSKWLPGGMDAVLGYGFSPYSRVSAYYLRDPALSVRLQLRARCRSIFKGLARPSAASTSARRSRS